MNDSVNDWTFDGSPLLLGQMRTWRTWLAVAIATLWVAAGSHCRLEVLSGLEFLSCCHRSEIEPSPAHHENECGSDGCAEVELGFYRLSKPLQAPLKPWLMLVTWLVPLPAPCPPSARDSLVGLASSPSEFTGAWQFRQRTALPPRAPSFAS